MGELNERRSLSDISLSSEPTNVQSYHFEGSEKSRQFNNRIHFFTRWENISVAVAVNLMSKETRHLRALLPRAVIRPRQSFIFV